MVDFSPTSPFPSAGSARSGAVSAPTMHDAPASRAEFREQLRGASDAPRSSGSVRKSGREELADGAMPAPLSAQPQQVDSDDPIASSPNASANMNTGESAEQSPVQGIPESSTAAVVADAAVSHTAVAGAAVHATQILTITSAAVVAQETSREVNAPRAHMNLQPVATDTANAIASETAAEVSSTRASAPNPLLTQRESSQLLGVALAPKSSTPSTQVMTPITTAQVQTDASIHALASPSQLAPTFDFSLEITRNTFIRTAQVAAQTARAVVHADTQVQDIEHATPSNASAQAIASRLMDVEREIARANATPASPLIDGEGMMSVELPTGLTLSNAQGQSSLASASMTESQLGQSVPVSADAIASRSAPTSQLSPNANANAELASQFNGKLVSRGLTALTQQRGGTLSIRLDPPELGAVQVKMVMQQGSVSVDFRAATPEARAILEMHLGALRSALEAQGLNVDRLQVEGSANGSSTLRNSASEQATSQFAALDRRAAVATASQSDASSDRSTRQDSSPRQDSAQGESRGRQEHHARLSRTPADAHAASAFHNADSFAFALSNGARS